VIAVARRLRGSEPGDLGLATALGWYATKHALGVYGNEPPGKPYANLSPEVPNGDARTVLEPADHEATAESGTVIYERDGSPSYGILFALTDDGDRVLGHTRNTDVLNAMAEDGFFGSRVRVREDRDFEPVA
jgi:acetyl-CoA C-acetyltransferase